MNKLFFPAVLSVCLMYASCSSNTNNQTATDEVSTPTDEVLLDTTHTSQNSLDWNGTYKGVIPCADCPGIATTVVLNADETFTYTAEYQDRNTKLEDTGKIMWHDHGSTVHLHGKDLDIKYKVGENKLIQLDQEGKEIDGSTKDLYNLIKQ